MMELPKIRDEVNSRNWIIDGTPNGEYALRILKAYRARCNEKWIVEGCDEGTKRIYDAMNEHQDLRAKELDKAILILVKNHDKDCD
jgi:hypothetical protein